MMSTFESATAPLPGYAIRTFEERDRAAVSALGSPVVGWWHDEVAGASLHLVAEEFETGDVVGHLQARDRSVPKPSRRPGQCHFMLTVSPNHRRKGIGSCLYDRLEAFACARKADSLHGGYTETPDAPGATFLRKRGFGVLERFLPSYRDLETFQPSEFQFALDKLERQGISIRSYARVGDTSEHRVQLYALEEKARAAQPFREVAAYVPTPYSKWEAEFLRRDQTAILLALAPVTEEYVGVVTSLEWGFTATDPDWYGRGIATALKVRCLQEAKARGGSRLETENHEDNAAMLAVNRKLGFVFAAPEVSCVKKISISNEVKIAE